MRFDEVLTRPDGPAVAQELAALRRGGRTVIDGVHQESPREHWQFRLDIDEARQTWTLDRSDQPTVSYRDGVLHDEDGRFEDSFQHSTVAGTVVRMAVPELMLRWGRGPESFHPVLVQHVGQHSVLVTFEHRGDPAVRTTLVVDERDGVARRSLEYGAATIITGVRAAEPDEVLPPASFDPLTDWIRPDY
jgi:hypothetical protein